VKNNKNYSIGGQRSELDGKLSCKMTALNRYYYYYYYY